MNTLVWKLLRRHTSIGQLAGFFLANLFGMTIVLLCIQFYTDVNQIFTREDSFLKNDFLIVTKKLNVFNTITNKNATFSAQEISDLRHQSFCKTLGTFTSSQFNVSASLGMANSNMHLSTEMFFEAVPDNFIDVNLEKWQFDQNANTIPIIIPKNYLNLYNFGFAQTHHLPKISEGIIGLIKINVNIRGNGQYKQYKGQIVGFSNRLNTILVPQSFMDWANKEFAPSSNAQPARIIIETNNPSDPSIVEYFRQKGYETEDGKLDNGKTSYFLRLTIGIVGGIGAFISILSFYILILSIFLLLQKNAQKLENLMLIGYSPWKVALPYQTLSTVLNAVILLLSIGLVTWTRTYYAKHIVELFPQWETGTLWFSTGIGILIFACISIFNTWIIRKKILSIWNHRN